jgi:starvation-inducible DNA-binding protein
MLADQFDDAVGFRRDGQLGSELTLSATTPRAPRARPPNAAAPAANASRSALVLRPCMPARPQAEQRPRSFESAPSMARGPCLTRLCTGIHTLPVDSFDQSLRQQQSISRFAAPLLSPQPPRGAHAHGHHRQVPVRGSEPGAKAPDIDIGISTDDRKQISESLMQALADAFTLYLKTHNFHWNITGKMFNSLHLMFETQYNEQWMALDEIAERIRALGYNVPASYEDFQRLTSIKPDTKVAHTDWREMVRQLVLGNEAVERSQRKAWKSPTRPATTRPSTC